MATFTTTTKYLLRWLTGTNTISDIDAGFQALAEDIDARMAGYAEGTLAALPGAGKAGRFYRTTDTGQVFMDTGAAWIEIGISPWNPGDLKASWLTVASAGWLLCDGAAVSRATYAALFAAIGTSAGAGNGSTTFNVPDFRGCVFVMPDGSAGRMANYDSRGMRGGLDEVTIGRQELPTGVPTITDGSLLIAPQGVASGTAKMVPGIPLATDTWQGGGGGAIENWPPYLVGGAVLIHT